MKVGDLVRYKQDTSGSLAGIVVDLIDKKMWNVDTLGKAVNWDVAPVEPHAVLLVGERYHTIPIEHLEVLSEKAD